MRQYDDDSVLHARMHTHTNIHMLLHAGIERERGHIGSCFLGSVVWFRGDTAHALVTRFSDDSLHNDDNIMICNEGS